jgi:hypothetical protein
VATGYIFTSLTDLVPEAVAWEVIDVELVLRVEVEPVVLATSTGS